MVLDQNFSPIIYTKLHHFGPGGNAISNGGAGSGNGSGYESDEGEPNGRCSPLLQQMQAKYLLPIPQFHDSHKKCMVIDLDETLVHSSFKVNSFVLFCLFFFLILTIHYYEVSLKVLVNNFQDYTENFFVTFSFSGTHYKILGFGLIFIIAFRSIQICERFSIFRNLFGSK